MSHAATNIVLAEHVRNVFGYKAPMEHTYEDTLNPAYWTHVATKLEPGSRIEVTAYDGSWWAELYVVSASRLWAKVVPLRHHELAKMTSSKTPINDEFYVKWGNERTKFRVHRRSDKQPVKEGFDTQEQAKEYIEELKKELM